MVLGNSTPTEKLPHAFIKPQEHTVHAILSGVGTICGLGGGPKCIGRGGPNYLNQYEINKDRIHTHATIA